MVADGDSVTNPLILGAVSEATLGAAAPVDAQASMVKEYHSCAGVAARSRRRLGAASHHQRVRRTRGS